MSLKESLATMNQRSTSLPAFPLPFPFPVKLHVVCIAGANEPNLVKCKSFPWFCQALSIRSFLAKPLYQRLIDLSGYDGSISVPENLHNESNVPTLFQKLAEDMYTSFKGVLKCGNLESKIILSPAPIVSLNCFIYIRFKLYLNILGLYKSNGL